jgi:hypothetical protein
MIAGLLCGFWLSGLQNLGSFPIEELLCKAQSCAKDFVVKISLF